MENQVKKMENSNGSANSLDRKVSISMRDVATIAALIFMFGGTWMTITATNNRQDAEIKSLRDDIAKDARDRADNQRETLVMLRNMQAEMVQMKLDLKEIQTKLSQKN